MATKTAEKLPTVDTATEDLAKAEAKLRDVRAAVVAGDTKVAPADIAEARSAVEYAQLRVELANDADTHRAEQARLNRIDEMVTSLTTGDVAAKGRKVVELEAKATAAIEALYVAARDYHVSARAIASELGRIGDLPGNIDVNHVNHQPGRVTIDGVLIAGTYNFGDWPGNVVHGATYRALHPHLTTHGDKVRDLYNVAAKSLAGGIRDEKRTATELLAEALDKLG